MMGIVDDSSFEIELDKFKGKSQKAEIKELNIGRGNGNRQVPDSLRKIIGENAIVEGNKETEALTNSLGISRQAMASYKNGATSEATYNQPNDGLKQHVDNVREKILTKARAKTLLAITHITKEKLEAVKARDLAGIAKDLSGVIRNLEPEIPSENNNRPFVVYAPQFRDERSFETIVVSE